MCKSTITQAANILNIYFLICYSLCLNYQIAKSFERPIPVISITRNAVLVFTNLIEYSCDIDRPCGLVVRNPGYRFRDPVSNPGATGSSEK
jgi:hypothetical protein